MALSVGDLAINVSTNTATVETAFQKLSGTIEGSFGKIANVIDLVQNKGATLAETFTRIGGVLAGAIGAGAFVHMIEGAISAQAELQGLSEKTGATVESLSAMRNAAKFAGTSMEDVGKGLQKLAAAALAATSGTGKQAEALKALGFNAKTFATDYKTTDEALVAVAKAMNQYGDGLIKTGLQQSLFGKSGAALNEFFKELAARGPGAVKVTAEQARAAKELEDAIVALKEKFNGLINTLATAIVPVLTKMIEGMDRFKEIALAAIAVFVIWPITMAVATAATNTYRQAVIAASLATSELGIATTVTSVLLTNFFGSFGALFGSFAALLKTVPGLLFAAFAGFQLGSFIREQFVDARIAALGFVEIMLKGWENIKYFGQIAWEVVKLGFFGFINSVRAALGGFYDLLAAGLSKIPGFDGLAESFAKAGASIRGTGDAVKEFDANIAKLGVQNNAAKAAIESITRDLIGLEIQTKFAAKANDEAAKAPPPVPKAAATALKDTISAIQGYLKALADLEKAYGGTLAKQQANAIQQQEADLQRAYTRGIVDFREYWNQKTALQAANLRIQEKQLQDEVAIQTNLVAQLQQAATAAGARTDYKDESARVIAITNANKELIEANAKLITTSGELVIVRSNLARVGKDYIESLIAESNGVLKSNKALDDEIELRERGIDAIGKTATEIIDLSIARVQEKLANTNLIEQTPELLAFYDGQIDRLKRLRTATAAGEGFQRQFDAWKDLFQNISDRGAQFIEDFVQHGKTSFRSLWEDFKGWALRALAQIAARQLVVSIAGAVGLTGAPGAAAGQYAQQGTQLLNLFSGQQPGVGSVGNVASYASNLVGGGATSVPNVAAGSAESSLFGGASEAGALFAQSAFGAAAGAGASAGLSTLAIASNVALQSGAAAGAAAVGGYGAVVGAAGAVLGAAIPIIGIAIAAYSYFAANKEPAKVKGRFQATTDTTGFEDNAYTANRATGLNLGFADVDTQQFSGEGAQVLNKVISGAIDAFDQRFTAEQRARLTETLSTTTFPSAEGEFTTEDFLKTYGAQVLQQVIVAAFDVLDPALASVAANFKGTADEISAFGNTLLAIHDATESFRDNFGDTMKAALANATGALGDAVISTDVTIDTPTVNTAALTTTVTSAVDGAVAAVRPNAAPLTKSTDTALKSAIDGVDVDASSVTDTIQGAIDKATVDVRAPAVRTAIDTTPVAAPTVPDDVAQQFVDTFIANVNKALEDATQETADKVLAFVQAVNTFSATIPPLAVTLASLDASKMVKFVDALGGAQKFATTMASFNQNFGTAAEVSATATNRLTTAFGSLGLEVPKTHEEFVKVLDNFIAIGDTDAVETLLGVSDAFVTLNGTAEQVRQTLLQASVAGAQYYGQHFLTPAEQLSQRQTADSTALYEATKQGTLLNGVLTEFGFDTVPTTVEGVRRLVNATIAKYGADSEEAKALFRIIPIIGDMIDSVDGFADAAKKATDVIIVSVGSIIKDSRTAAEKELSKFSSLAGESTGDFGAKLALQVKLINDAIAHANRADFGSNTAFTAYVGALKSSGDQLTAQLGRFYALSEQFDAARAEQLVGLEQWYSEQRAIFGGAGIDAQIANLQKLRATYVAFGQIDLVAKVDEQIAAINASGGPALDALRQIFDAKWDAIVNGAADAAQSIDDFIKSIQQTAAAPRGNAGQRAGIELALSTVKLAQLQAAYTAALPGSALAAATATDIAKLKAYNALLATQIQHFTTYSAQYGDDVATQLVDLEVSFEAWKTSVAGNAAALAIVTDIFNAQFQKIVDGVKDGADELGKIQQSIRDYLKGLATSDLSPLTPKQKLDTAQSTFDIDIAKAFAGDQTAMANVTKDFDDLLRVASDYYASSQPYLDIFNAGRDQLARLAQSTPEGQPLTGADAIAAALPAGSTLASAVDIQQQTAALLADTGTPVVAPDVVVPTAQTVVPTVTSAPVIEVAAPIVNVTPTINVAPPAITFAPVINVAAPAVTVAPAVVNVALAPITVAPPVITVAPVVNVAAPVITVAPTVAAIPAPVVNVAPAVVTVNLSPLIEVAAAVVNVAPPEVNLSPVIDVAAPVFNLALPALDLSPIQAEFDALFARLQPPPAAAAATGPSEAAVAALPEGRAASQADVQEAAQATRDLEATMVDLSAAHTTQNHLTAEQNEILQRILSAYGRTTATAK